MRSTLIIGVLTALAGTVLWGVTSSPRPEFTSAGQKDIERLPNGIVMRQLADRIVFLEEKLANTRDTRHRLLQRLGELESRLAFYSDVQSRNTAEVRTASDIGENLRRLGLPEYSVDQVVQRLGENRMDLLSMRDRAAREGWMDTSEYAKMLDDLANPSSEIRAEFGDGIYDYYLYAAGKPNRVLVTDVYRNSAAEVAGIQAGDLVLRYDSEGVFSMLDIKQATVEGRSGESVLVELQRDGGSVFVTIPRGPIGITMAGQQVTPGSQSDSPLTGP